MLIPILQFHQASGAELFYFIPQYTSHMHLKMSSFQPHSQSTCTVIQLLLRANHLSNLFLLSLHDNIHTILKCVFFTKVYVRKITTTS